MQEIVRQKPHLQPGFFGLKAMATRFVPAQAVLALLDSVFYLCPAVATRRPVLSATIRPDIKRTLVAMSVRTGMTVSQVTDEVLYTGILEMQELDLPEG